MAAGEDLHGAIDGNGELLDLAWVPLAEARSLPIPCITGLVLDEVARLLRSPPGRASARRVPLCRRVRGAHVVELE